MHKLSAFSLKNRALIALVTVVVATFGALAFTNLKQELIPSIEVPQLAVLTVHPGASAEVVASDVTAPVEKALQTVPGLLGTTTTSSTGVSVVMAEFEFGTDTAKVEQKMAQSISRIRSYLPEGTDPSVMAISLDDFPVIQVAVSSDNPEKLAGTLAESVVPALERLDGVASASIIGAPGPRVSITPRAEDMALNGVTSQSIATLLMQNGVMVPAGTIVDAGSEMAVQVGTRLTSVDQIEDLPLVRSQVPGMDDDALQGLPPVTLGDVADVELTTDPTTSYSLVDGRKALTLSITKLPDANTVDVSHAVQDALPELEASVAGSSFDVLVDQAPFIEDSISGLATEGLLGLVMAIIVILAFLRSGRATLVTAVSIPVSLLIAFVGMQAAGYTLNILSLGGLTIAIGRIVDDSIVVIENVERHMRYGKSRRRTIVDAVREVGGAITASTVTTVAVFVPIALVGGMSGVLFRPFAFTVAIAMGASLLVSLTIVPVLAFWFLSWKGHAAAAAAVDAADDASADAPADVPALVAADAEQADDELTEEAQGGIQRSYARTLDWALGHRWTTVGIAVAVLVGTLALVPLMKTSFLGDMAQNSLGITQQVKPGTSLEKQLATASTVDEALRQVDGVELVAATIGQTDQSLMLGGADTISYSITTDENGDQAKIQEAVRKAVTAVVDADDVTISPFAGMGMSNDVQISVTGSDAKAVASGTEAIAEAMRPLDGVRQVSTTLTDARPTVSVVIDRAKAAAAGLTETQLSQAVAGMITPQQIGAVTIGGSSVSVFLTPEDPARSVSGIRELPLGPGGATVGDVAEVKVVDGPVSITTQNGVRNQVVDVTPESDDLGQTSSVVTTALEGVDLPDGVTAEIGGVTAEQDEAFSQLGLAMLVAILIVYVVMVATFRSLLHPLLLLVSIPFAATGAILLQVATGVALGVPSLIGVLMLIGIVVTNAIVLVDLVKQYRDRGVPMADALRRGAVHRVRPILMTAAATILALAPMAIGVTGHGGFISQPLAIVVIGGLFSSTLMTLIVLPVLYHLVESIGKRGATRVLED
ncbi:efflux RND transporter permease subunit [Sanguibacter sp. HDW7]|uniref:efflux RND transporter permease subunit n=1 Tax=Sanguibacter sp. HDW7 TaxID=2714931 RepID=UPI00140785A3|nr:efflux RND transporter permease subunit [Sanguibacter sp. HDW7]QIK82314.1 efflux RND transporter permease subunit [Sanguibacter sp. HDW7]